MVKPKIACYITGGWTECGYMTRFLGRISDKFDYRQRFPKKNIGKKGKSRKIFKVEGTTGSDLMKLVYDDLKKHKEELRTFSAVLIEDDMDDRFFLKEQCKRDYEQIEKRNNVVRKEVRMILEKEDMPVFFLYALPEIESWFLADWENTFGIEYRQKLGKINSYFSITFKNFVSRYVLTETYDIKDVENYGYFNGEYRKLSDKLILAFQEYSCVEDKTKNNQEYNCFINELIQANQIMYSKKEEGKNMLSRLDPERVAENCGHYFAKIYIDLKEFGCKNVDCN